MIDILFYTTLVLNFSGLLFAGVYLWMNIFGHFADIAERNASVIKIATISAVSAAIFAFLSCLFAPAAQINAAIAQTALLYSVIAITWLCVMLACGALMLVMVTSKRFYKSSISRAVKRLFFRALPCAIICLALSWLFS